MADEPKTQWSDEKQLAAIFAGLAFVGLLDLALHEKIGIAQRVAFWSFALSLPISVYAWDVLGEKRFQDETKDPYAAWEMITTPLFCLVLSGLGVVSAVIALVFSVSWILGALFLALSLLLAWKRTPPRE
jgi:hypothetical protein